MEHNRVPNIKKKISKKYNLIIMNTTKKELVISVQPFTRYGVIKGNRDSYLYIEKI